MSNHRAAADLFTSPSMRRHRDRLTQLASVLDPFTRRRLTEVGVGPGARCLEVGAGTGSVATWMATQVGLAGQVIATDLDVSLLPDHPAVTRVGHDITTDSMEHLGVGGGFDLVHARLVLSHLPGRQQVVGTLADVLAPGGALVVEEFDGGWNRYVVQTPDTEVYRLFADYHEAMTGVLESCGKDVNWEVVTAMNDAQLADVDSQMWSKAWRGGQAGAVLLRDTLELEPLRDRLIAAGMSEPDLVKLGGMLGDPELVVYMHPLVSTVGYRPVPEAGLASEADTDGVTTQLHRGETTTPSGPIPAYTAG